MFDLWLVIKGELRFILASAGLRRVVTALLAYGLLLVVGGWPLGYMLGEAASSGLFRWWYYGEGLVIAYAVVAATARLARLPGEVSPVEWVRLGHISPLVVVLGRALAAVIWGVLLAVLALPFGVAAAAVTPVAWEGLPLALVAALLAWFALAQMGNWLYLAADGVGFRTVAALALVAAFLVGTALVGVTPPGTRLGPVQQLLLLLNPLYVAGVLLTPPDVPGALRASQFFLPGPDVRSSLNWLWAGLGLAFLSTLVAWHALRFHAQLEAEVARRWASRRRGDGGAG